MNLKEMEKLCNDATPGPWIFRSKDPDDPCSDLFGKYSVGPDPENYSTWIIDDTKYYPTAPERIEDARFIAASRDLMPKLIAVAKAAKAYRDEMDKDENWRDHQVIERFEIALNALEKDE